MSTKCIYFGPCLNMNECSGRHYCESQEHMKLVRERIAADIHKQKEKKKQK